MPRARVPATNGMVSRSQVPAICVHCGDPSEGEPLIGRFDTPGANGIRSTLALGSGLLGSTIGVGLGTGPTRGMFFNMPIPVCKQCRRHGDRGVQVLHAATNFVDMGGVCEEFARAADHLFNLEAEAFEKGLLESQSAPPKKVERPSEQTGGFDWSSLS